MQVQHLGEHKALIVTVPTIAMNNHVFFILFLQDILIHSYESVRGRSSIVSGAKQTTSLMNVNPIL